MHFLMPLFVASILLTSTLSYSDTTSDQSLIKNESSLPQATDKPSSVDIKELERFIDGYVNAMINDFEPPGVLVTVVVGDQQITKGYGVADASTGRLVDENTLFKIASISKTFVWLSAHKLADEGKLDLDADINDYFDDFKIEYKYDQPITMRHLMGHRPGFDDYVRYRFDSDRDISLHEAVKRNIPEQVAFPGERVSYSNVGTNMAAYIVERVSGVSYFEYVEENILKPLNMNSTSLKEPIKGRIDEDLLNRMAKPHRIRNGVPEVVDYAISRPLEPVGAAAMDAVDAAKFMRFLLNETKYKDGQLLSEQAWSRVTSYSFSEGEGGDDMGWGFMLNDIDGYKALGHGGTLRFLSWLLIVPELNVGVFVSSNSYTKASRPTKLAWQIVREITGKGSMQSFLQLKGDPVAAKAIAGEYIDNRRQHSRGLSFFGLGKRASVKATDDGFLLFNQGTTSRYAPLGNDVWVAKDGFRLRVVRDENQNIVRLHGRFGSTTYERIGFLSSDLALALGYGGVMFFSFTGLMGIYYRHGRKNDPTKISRILAWINIISIASWLLFAVNYLVVASDLSSINYSKIDEIGFPPSSVSVGFLMMYVVTFQTAVHLIALLPVWKKSGWNLWRRIHFTILGLFSAFAVFLLFHWEMIGGSVYGR